MRTRDTERAIIITTTLMAATQPPPAGQLRRQPFDGNHHFRSEVAGQIRRLEGAGTDLGERERAHWAGKMEIAISSAPSPTARSPLRFLEAKQLSLPGRGQGRRFPISRFRPPVGPRKQPAANQSS